MQWLGSRGLFEAVVIVIYSKVHRLQTRLLQREAGGARPGGSVLLVHAQDLLMAAMTERDLAERMLDLYRRLYRIEARQVGSQVLGNS